MLTLAQERDELLPMIDRLLADRTVPPGARGIVARLIDQHRFHRSPGAARPTLEALALHLHRLDDARRRGDEPAIETSLGAIRACALSVIDGRLRGALAF